MSEEATFRSAVIAALTAELEADGKVLLLGEDIGAAGGAFKATEGLQEKFGENRVRDTPISEQAIIGAAIGAGLSGFRPVAEIMFADFAAVCFDGLINELPKYRYMTGGQVNLPVTVRLANGGGTGFGAQHSQAAENWFLGAPGLKIVAPAFPQDAYSLLRAAVQDPDPVLFFEHKSLYNTKGPLDLGGEDRIGPARVVKPGRDVTVVATQMMVLKALEAAEELAGESVDVEVVDLRSLMPLDTETVGESIDRTNHLVVVQESTFGGSWGATLVARLMIERFESLDSPPLVVGGDETPIPHAGSLESVWIPDATRIADAVRGSLA